MENMLINEKNKKVIDYITEFLNYCKNQKYSPSSIKTYSGSLNKFAKWLTEFRISDNASSPIDFSPQLIENYKNYLKTEKTSTRTQNGYLIGLRVFLKYLIDRNIKTLAPQRVVLYKEDHRTGKEIQITSTYLKKLLNEPKIETVTGARDRAILSVVFFTGLRVSQIIALNRKDRSKFSQLISEAIERYLSLRQDKEEALFIRFKGPRLALKRLTTRSIESIVKKYQQKIKDTSLITPENLRGFFLKILLKKQQKIKINKPFKHKIASALTIEQGKQKKVYQSQNNTINNWYNIEKCISQEEVWLKSKISFFPQSYRSESPINCDNCIIKKIAVLIVSGYITATELPNVHFWQNNKKRLKEGRKRHGQEWHHNLMSRVAFYFENKKYKVEKEPKLFYGRADLGFFLKDNSSSVYIEIGTVSIFKIWYNLLAMQKIVFLLIPSENFIIELRNY